MMMGAWSCRRWPRRLRPYRRRRSVAIPLSSKSRGNNGSRGNGCGALGCLLVVATLYVTVVANMRGGPHSGLLNIPANAWAVLWAELPGGHFWIATGVAYSLVQIIRLTVWAVRQLRWGQRRRLACDRRRQDTQ
jgi:hypothetical protein